MKRLILIAIWMSCAAQADVSVSDANVPAFDDLESRFEVEFAPLAKVPQNDVAFELINGKPVNPEKFPAILRMTTRGTCTATLVGPAVVLLAAHCINQLSRVSFVFGDQRVQGICEQATGYRAGDGQDDWALCLLQRRVAGIPFESIDINQVVPTGTRLMLTGYGCTERGGPLDYLLRIGMSNATTAPTGWTREDSTIYTKSDLSAGEAVLCPGDSGGPAFRFAGGVEGPRSIVGVNSRTTFSFGYSLLSATASVNGRHFISSWKDRYGVSICGVNLVEGCR